MYRLQFYLIAFLLIPLKTMAKCLCDSIPDNGHTQITVSNVEELENALDVAYSSNGNLTIRLSPGTYQLTSNLRFISSNMKNLTIMGSSGNASAVEIYGLGWNDANVTHIFNVAADSFVVANMTIGQVFYHPIQVHSHPNDADFFLAHNVRFIDAKEQLLKVSGGSTTYADRGVVECCIFEFSNSMAFQDYTGGIDAHQAKDWIVRNNTFKNIKSPNSTLAEHAIHFWRRSTNTLVENNVIINCDRGIGFGLGNDLLNGHPQGLIRNNFVHTSTDVGIGLEYAPDVKIYNNTVIAENYTNAIEYRFAGTSNVHIANNLTKGIITDRSSGSSGTVESNVDISSLQIFTDSANHDYHLTGAINGIVDAGIFLAQVISDIDCENRPMNNALDIGADEYTANITNSDLVINNSDILIYPNPVQDQFTISGMLQSYNIEVLDQAGQIYMVYDQSAENITIDIGALPAGLYFIKVESKQNLLLCIKLILKT